MTESLTTDSISIQCTGEAASIFEGIDFNWDRIKQISQGTLLG